MWYFHIIHMPMVKMLSARLPPTPQGDIVRLVPPLVLTDDDIAKAVDVLGKAIAQVTAAK